MSDFERLDFRSDDVLRASDLNLIVDQIRRTSGRVEVGDGLCSESDGRGGVRITATARGVYVAAATTAITARSGVVAGTGRATLHVLDHSGNLVAGGDEVDVFNFSGAAGGIDAGKFLMVMMASDDRYWVISAEC